MIRSRKEDRFQYRVKLVGMALTALGIQLGTIEGFPGKYVVTILTSGAILIAIAQFPLIEFLKGKPDARNNKR